MRDFFDTIDSKRDFPLHLNLLARQFNPSWLIKASVSDNTCIFTRSGWLCPTVVIDLIARKVVGWAMAFDMPALLVCAALRMTIRTACAEVGRDRALRSSNQYAGAAHQAVLSPHELVRGMN